MRDRAHHPRPSVLLTALVISIAGCGKQAAPASPDAGPADPAQDIGGFDIQLVPAVAATMDTPAVPAQTALLGGVRSGSTPARVDWRVTAEEGACRLVVPEVPFCDPACPPGAVCTRDRGCVTEAAPRSAGTVRVRGLQAQPAAAEIVLAPSPPRFDYQFPANLRLAYPPFAPDANVEVLGQGGDIGAFTLATPAIAPLEIPVDGTPMVRPGSGYALRWGAPPAGATSRVLVIFDLSLHAGTKGKLECEVADTGALDVSASLMGKLVALGTAGFPKVVVNRRSVATTGLPAGRVKLSVFCEIQRELIIEGQISCDEDTDCPSRRCLPSSLCG